MTRFTTPDQVRHQFSQSLSSLYRDEVPQYGTLLELVDDINRATLDRDAGLRDRMTLSGDMQRLNVERHGAIRLGTAQELSNMRRVLGVMGMHPVGYYDLSVAGVPVHSTAFRPVDDASLRINPFRVFCSLLRLELIEDAALREQARQILEKRQIFSPRALELTQWSESQGGLDAAQATEFVREVTQTFRWHGQATVSHATYQQLNRAHRLVADVVSFRGPHINHLTPRTLDIDAAQAEMPRRGIVAKDVIEGPPRRRHPILLRQTSFKALEEPVAFAGNDERGAHTARFGEIEQRGAALTARGRALYDNLLEKARSADGAGSGAADYAQRLQEVFAEFPDDLDALHDQGLAFFHYTVTDTAALEHMAAGGAAFDLGELRRRGIVVLDPIVYEDFLPVSAAGIFQSNLGGREQAVYQANAARESFEEALQGRVADEITLYEQSQQRSLDRIRRRHSGQA